MDLRGIVRAAAPVWLKIIGVFAAILMLSGIFFALYKWGGDSGRRDRADDYTPMNTDSLIASIMNANTWYCGSKPKPRAVTAALKNGTLTVRGKGAVRDYYEDRVLVEPWHLGTYEDVMKKYRTFYWAPWRFKSKFDSAASVTDIIVENGVTGIGLLAFVGLPKLNSISIPASVSSIDKAAISDCDSHNMFTCNYHSLSAINVAEGNAQYSSVDGVLFNKNKTVLIMYPKDKRRESYTIQNSVTAIAARAFLGADLKSVDFPCGVTSIGRDAFTHSGLTSVTFPGSVAVIENSAFYGCAALTSLTIEEGVTSIDAVAFFNCGGLTSVVFPRSVTSIGDGAFALCTSLTSVTIGDGVTDVGGYVFHGCTGLTSVTFSSGVKHIGNRVFVECENLRTIVVLSPVPPVIESETFADIPTDACLYVPKSAVRVYRATAGWNRFQCIKTVANNHE